MHPNPSPDRNSANRHEPFRAAQAINLHSRPHHAELPVIGQPHRLDLGVSHHDHHRDFLRHHGRIFPFHPDYDSPQAVPHIGARTAETGLARHRLHPIGAEAGAGGNQEPAFPH